MPSRFASGAYEPEIVTLMGEAFELAWKDFRLNRPHNQTLAKELLDRPPLTGPFGMLVQERALG